MLCKNPLSKRLDCLISGITMKRTNKLFLTKKLTASNWIYLKSILVL